MFFFLLHMKHYMHVRDSIYHYIIACLKVIPYIKSEMKVINLICAFNHLLQQASL